MVNTTENSAVHVSNTRSRAIARLYTRLNVWVYRLTNGRMMNTIQGRPICIVEMTGAKSGKKRSIPLVYVRDGSDFLLVASMGGAPSHPAWYYNLKSRPEIDLTVNNRRNRFVANLLEGEAYTAAWQDCVAHFPDYQAYQSRTERIIPIFRCTEIDDDFGESVR